MTEIGPIAALLGDDRAAAEGGYRCLLKAARYCGFPGMKAASEDDVREKAHAYVAWLREDPSRVRAATTLGVPGLKVALRRFIDRNRSDSVEEHGSAHYAHFYAKCGEILRTDPTFEIVQAPGKSIRRYQLRAPEGRLEVVSPDSLRDLLPPLEAKLQVVDERQFPEVADRAEMVAQLQRIFEHLGNASQTLGFLVETTYRTLSPRPSEFAAEPSCDHEGPKATTPARQEQMLVGRDLAVLAETFVAELPARTRVAAKLKFGGEVGLTLEQIAKSIGTSRGTAENEIGNKNGRFQALLRSAVGARDLNGSEAELLVGRVLEILRAGGFKEEERKCLP